MTPVNLIKSLEKHNSEARITIFSPDDSLLAVAASNDGCINIYRTSTGILQTSTMEHKDMIWDISFSASGAHILSACDDGTARLFNTTTGMLEKQFHDDSEGWSDERMFVACFTPDNKAIATGTDIVQIWNLETGELVRELIGPRDRDVLPVASIEAMGNVLQDETSISSIEFSPDGRSLVSVGEEVKLWDTRTRTLEHTLQGNSPVFSPDGDVIATSSRSHTIHLWDAGSGHLLYELSSYGIAAPSVLFTSDSRTLLSNSGRIVHVWDVISGHLELLLEDHKKQIYTMALSPDGITLVIGSKDRTVRLWDVNTGDCLQVLEEHVNEVWGVAFSSDGKRLVTSDDGGKVLLWEVQSS
ncbi:WD40 repeat-like protein [Aureobasidium melanogenum CBS 110374]|uniref:WD40 repeat-like protein n=1 Tax=Aureobasidium melanogenum (strain CBS 110374) TaxID=1043003 RepID=A0A074W3D4_AURM1|nr:WD40 repeat-like protein [Aureobasidium melanogenum CBS 110374]KEQ64447.1 WD40 repeat-like protein [Aureobasidium melanogenum CBS 110374]